MRYNRMINNNVLSTDKIHLGAKNYQMFCDFANITFIQDSYCDSYTGITGITEYNNPIVKGKLRWSYTLYGNMVTCYSKGSDKLHEDILNKHFTIPESYLTNNRYMTKYSFENWLNDQLIAYYQKG